MNKNNESSAGIKYNKEKIDDMVLALLHFTTFKGQSWYRAWKSMDWEAMNRLHEKGFISDPKNKSKPVRLTEEGVKKSKELFEK